MIRESKGEKVAECNDCGAEHYGGTLDFLEFVDDLKSEGWKIKKNGDEWEHYCPDCRD